MNFTMKNNIIMILNSILVDLPVGRPVVGRTVDGGIFDVGTVGESVDRGTDAVRSE